VVDVNILPKAFSLIFDTSELHLFLEFEIPEPELMRISEAKIQFSEPQNLTGD